MTPQFRNFTTSAYYATIVVKMRHQGMVDEMPPEPEKLPLEVGTPFDRKSVPGFLHFEPFEFGISWKSQRWAPL